jgi:hypothetical protein
MELGADANRTTVGTGIKTAAEAANNILLWGDNSIESTGDEGFLIDAAALLGKGLAQGMTRRALSILSRFAASHIDDIGRAAVPPAVKAVAPTVTQIMQNLVDDAVAAITSNPKLILQFVSRGSIEAAKSDPRLVGTTFGKAVERIVAKRIKDDPTLRSLFVHANQRAANGRFREIYDFAGIGRGQGLLFDVTTRADMQVAGHAGRWYSDLVEYILYDIPQGFKLP